MELYKIIIADDEESVRNGIINRVQWRENGFEVVGGAENGREALELCEALRPDLVVTDIKMPYMDGLELVNRLQAVLPLTKTVIITGFDDFDYAKQAISLGVAEYVLKPVNVDELTGILRKVKAVMDAEAEARRDLRSLREHYGASLPILREHLLLSLIEGRVNQARERELSRAYGLNLSGKLYTAACLRFDAGGDPERAGLIQLSVKRLCEETLSKRLSARVLIYTDYIVAVVALNDLKDAERVIVAMNEVCELAERDHGVRVSAGIGYLCGGLDGLSVSYKGALAALDYRTLSGAGRAIFINDIEPGEGREPVFDALDEQRLLGAIRLAGMDEITRVVEQILSRCSNGDMPFKHYEIYLIEIITAVLRISRSFQIDVDSIFGADFDILRKLSGFESLPALKEWLTMVCLRVSGNVRRERNNTSRRLVDDAKEYAARYFSNSELSVERMCAELHVSPSYFSSLFKRSEGESFVNWLTTLRLNEAVRLLSETDDKTYMIAEKVGIPDANYFSFVFKKRFGVSPSKYRG